MAVYRTVHLSFWTDSKVDDNFTPEDKYFYLYLLTNPHTNICGCYEIGDKQFSRETGYNAETISRLIQRFQNIHNVIRYDPETKEILILNWYKYNWTSSDKLMKNVEEVAKTIKSDVFRDFVFSLIGDYPDTVSIPYPYPIDTSDTVTVSDTVSDTVSVPDTEAVNRRKKVSQDNWKEIEDLFGYNEFLLEAVKDWVTYKKEKKQPYRGTGLKSLLTQIRNRIDEYGEDAVISVIQDSMASNYTGIVWDKLKQKSRQETGKKYSAFDILRREEQNDKERNSEDYSSFTG